MLGSFWEAVGNKLADRVAAVSLPALIFWLAGLAAWTWHAGGLHTLTRHTDWLNKQTGLVQGAVILTALLSIGASGILIHQAATPLLRLLEGYWPAWTNPLRHRLATRHATRAATEETAWQTAYAAAFPTPPATPSVEQIATYNRLEQRRRRHPPAATPGYFLPTPIGNILRAAERRPHDKYGLDAIICWPRLWPLLPDTLRQDLLAARASLDTAATTTLWALLYCAFAPLTLWAIPIGLTIATLTLTLAIPTRAQAFGDLLEAAYDTHRALLYTHLRWPPPTDPQDEHEQGRQLTTYLLRGSDNTTPTFTPPT
ncbi:hypothetical protein I6A84_04035 [Frankia sp. CNm7]|uniref:Vegetative cell wall protein gp1 n=1 Tax=Frankia nepalensis TaxID=1836974 RepID=A0A937RAQ9_9ACTN|nr:hypothetical protein [Frankia nepalensis]MBL7500865.1 hypothetical protein [Frankia nepalensis]MBL7509231.1 hypothetical protein [Frankia nepalensis]MBL7517310.1 hypothetical protein [Frankia nepalensis]MBL7627005.1 hypothetical protein [Frankia nepalensis]